MTDSRALPCPSCNRTLEPHSWFDDTSGLCRRCETEFEFVPLPALNARRTAVRPQVAEIAADSVCFFHAGNRAEAVCDECGRLLCSVCAVPFMGRRLCPTCMATVNKKTDAPAVAVRDRVLWDSIALSVAILPLLVWVLTILTAPVALGFVVYGWNKPGSLVRGRGHWRFVVAALFAIAEIVGWILVFWYVPGRRR